LCGDDAMDGERGVVCGFLFLCGVVEDGGCVDGGLMRMEGVWMMLFAMYFGRNMYQ